MNPLLPRSYSSFLVSLTLGLIALFFALGTVADLAIADGMHPERGFFTLELQWGGGTRMWVIQLFAVLLSHSAIITSHSFFAGQVTRGPTHWVGLHIPFPALILAGKSLATTVLITALFFVVRNSDRLCY